ncbi:hypothetical protein [Jannaschia donghaensis]|uniref:hypothetical protein n=1 Tax=Jannaschia donghaensis TaxID=420998 RepID=UPI0011873EB8|nr:hypothetical protein [Jannaschia donghaensis]
MKLLMPVAAICGSIAAGLLIAGDLTGRSHAREALDPSQFDQIEFVARVDRPEARALQDALDRACGLSGCDATTVHPMVLASTEQMTPEELKAGLDAQVRVRAESQAIRNRSLPGTPAATMAEMEILAAERITAFYEMELAER